MTGTGQASLELLFTITPSHMVRARRTSHLQFFTVVYHTTVTLCPGTFAADSGRFLLPFSAAFAQESLDLHAPKSGRSMSRKGALQAANKAVSRP